MDLFRSLEPNVRWTGADLERSPEVDQRTRADADFVTFDGERLPFPDASFDLVYCKQVLEHVRRPRPLLAEVARVLRPDGWLAGSTSHLEAFHSRSVFNYTPYGLMLLFEEAGLELVEVRAGDRRVHADRLAGARHAALLLPLVGARVARLPGHLAAGARHRLGPPHREHGEAHPRAGSSRSWHIRCARRNRIAR